MSEFKAVCKDDNACIPQLKQQNQKDDITCQHLRIYPVVSVLTSNITFLILAVLVV